MHRKPVSSSRIASVGWEKDTLEVEFNRGAVYQYYDVSYNEYLSFMNSSSLGSTLSQLDKTHRYSRV